MKKIKFDGMLMATLLTTIFYSSTYPYINKTIISAVSDKFIAVNQIINCISVVVLGAIWNKKSDKLYNFYPLICILETILGIGTTLFATLTKNIIWFYILDTLVFSIVTRNIICGGVKLKAIRYNSEKDREQFDNNNNSASAIATIIGSGIAMLLNLDFTVMLWLATFGNAIDNIFYIFIYFKTKKLKENDENVQ